jgi:hypothetical protein
MSSPKKSILASCRHPRTAVWHCVAIQEKEVATRPWVDWVSQTFSECALSAVTFSNFLGNEGALAGKRAQVSWVCYIAWLGNEGTLASMRAQVNWLPSGELGALHYGAAAARTLLGHGRGHGAVHDGRLRGHGTLWLRAAGPGL